MTQFILITMMCASLLSGCATTGQDESLDIRSVVVDVLTDIKKNETGEDVIVESGLVKSVAPMLPNEGGAILTLIATIAAGFLNEKKKRAEKQSSQSSSGLSSVLLALKKAEESDNEEIKNAANKIKPFMDIITVAAGTSETIKAVNKSL